MLSPLLSCPGFWYAPLAEIEKKGWGQIKHLPISIRILLESLLRQKGKEEEIRALSNWPHTSCEIPFVVGRVLLQDFTGVPLLVDLAAMRQAAVGLGKDPTMIQPLVPVDLVVDHSVQVDRSGTPDAFSYNLRLEWERNQERYAFLKWGQQAFSTLRIIPPGCGIVHQVNLEYLASVVSQRQIERKEVLFPDTLVGTDSHTTMVNGLGVLGWGVGGIEAEAAMLGQPIFLQAPQVVGVELRGALKEGVTATDLALSLTEMLRKEQVVGQFVEFWGEGASRLSVEARASISNMAPEYGATTGFFPVDEKTLDYLKMTGRSQEQVDRIYAYLLAQEMFGMTSHQEIQFSRSLQLDLGQVEPSCAGPKRPQDRLPLSLVKPEFEKLLHTPVPQGGYGRSKNTSQRTICIREEGTFSLQKHHDCGGAFALPSHSPVQWSEEEMVTNRPLTEAEVRPGYSDALACDLLLQDGSIVIAAITSCTNTSNPELMLAAGLLAKKAVEKGLKISPLVKTSLAPGSKVVAEYLKKAGLLSFLEQLGFHVVAYGCTTCIGNSGPLDEKVEKALKEHNIIAASVLSGNRNFEARIHAAVKANFLMSPPLVIAYALAGTIRIDLSRDPIGKGRNGEWVYLQDLWPDSSEVQRVQERVLSPSMFQSSYQRILEDVPLWEKLPVELGPCFSWNSQSSYIQHPPYFAQEQALPMENMRPLLLLGDSVTTDHISPAGAIAKEGAAGQYLLSLGVSEKDFNSYGSRRGNHEVMIRGTFANVRLRNFLQTEKEGGYTRLLPGTQILHVFEAAQEYRKRQIPLIVLAGKDYGMGSSRDWAAKGTALLGVRAVVAKSFERIHRSNLIGMGVLPLLFSEGEGWEELGIVGDERFSCIFSIENMRPGQKISLWVEGKQKRVVEVRIALETPTEVLYYQKGGILPFVLSRLCHAS